MVDSTIDLTVYNSRLVVPGCFDSAAALFTNSFQRRLWAVQWQSGRFKAFPILDAYSDLAISHVARQLNAAGFRTKVDEEGITVYE